MERIGRRFTGMFIANALMLLAILLQCLSPLVNYYELYILGQFVQGFGSAFAPALIMFMAESVPDRFRGGWAHALGGGKCVGVTAMFVGAGSYMVITFAAIMCVGDIFGNEHRWPYFPLVSVAYTHCQQSLITQAAIPLALPQMLTFRYFPASPKFLYLVRKSRTRALEAIRFYHGKKADAGERAHAHCARTHTIRTCACRLRS
jgi:MFS family permease